MLSLSGTSSPMLSLGFNQDAGCFAVGTDQGFRIYNCEPFKETFRRDFSSGGIGMVEMLFRCNILALVGGGRTPRYPPHKVMIWDDHQNRCIGELSFRSEVRAVRLRRDRVVVALDRRVYTYNFADLTLVDHVETTENPRGLCALCALPSSNVLAVPGAVPGRVRVELYDLKKTTLIAAHETALACIALNPNGSRLATASEKGTLIRVYDTSTGELLQELRRGTDKADVYCIAFNSSSTMLAVTSDKGTVHIFKLKDHNTTAISTELTSSASSMTSGRIVSPPTVSELPESTQSSSSISSSSSSSLSARDTTAAPTSNLVTQPQTEGFSSEESARAGGANFNFIKAIMPRYFSSEWSFAQFRIPEGKSICAFGSEPNTIVVVSADGSFFKASFEKGGEATRIAYASIVNE